MRTRLFQGCSRSEISITPKNWNTKKASLKKPWKLHYRFYDPVFRSNPKLWGYQVAHRTMNEHHTLEGRQEMTKALIAHEEELLDLHGFNPITKLYMRPPVEVITAVVDIDPKTKFITALEQARLRLAVIPPVRIDIKSVIGGVEKVARQLYDSGLDMHYIDLQICQVSRKHIKNILELCAKTRARWSAKRHNLYKCYLSMLFTELLQLEAVDANPTHDVPSKTQPFKQREVLTADEMTCIDEYLRVKDYNFWRYMRIFFYSGARTTELLQVRKDSRVNLSEQTFIVRVIKGGQDREDIRGISNEALGLWKEVWNEAKAGQVLFSKFLRPGDFTIRKDQPGRRWNKHVKSSKTGLGIRKDFYSLKHKHTDAIAAALDIQHAQTADGHLTPVITLKHYAPGEKKRQLKKVGNAGIKFSQSSSAAEERVSSIL